ARVAGVALPRRRDVDELAVLPAILGTGRVGGAGRLVGGLVADGTVEEGHQVRGHVPGLHREGEVSLARNLVHHQVVANLADGLDGAASVTETGRLEAVHDVATRNRHD